jgi:hypothetical protein
MCGSERQASPRSAPPAQRMFDHGVGAAAGKANLIALAKQVLFPQLTLSTASTQERSACSLFNAFDLRSLAYGAKCATRGSRCALSTKRSTSSSSRNPSAWSLRLAISTCWM